MNFGDTPHKNPKGSHFHIAFQFHNTLSCHPLSRVIHSFVVRKDNFEAFQLSHGISRYHDLGVFVLLSIESPKTPVSFLNFDSCKFAPLLTPEIVDWHAQ